MYVCILETEKGCSDASYVQVLNACTSQKKCQCTFVHTPPQVHTYIHTHTHTHTHTHRCTHTHIHIQICTDTGANTHTHTDTHIHTHTPVTRRGKSQPATENDILDAAKLLNRTLHSNASKLPRRQRPAFSDKQHRATLGRSHGLHSIQRYCHSKWRKSRVSGVRATPNNSSSISISESLFLLCFRVLQLPSPAGNG